MLGFTLADLLAKALGVSGGLPELTQQTAEITGLPIIGDITSGISGTAKAALLALLGTVGIAATGLVIAADKFSDQRITIAQVNREPKGTLQRIEEFLGRHKKEISTFGALILLGGMIGLGSQLPQEETVISTEPSSLTGIKMLVPNGYIIEP